MKRVVASVLSILLCIPQIAFSEPQALRDLFRSEYGDTRSGFFRPQTQSPLGAVTINGTSIVATVRGQEIRVEIDRADRVLRYVVEGNVWVGTLDENGRIVELRDPQGTPHYPTRMSAEQARAAANAYRLQVEYFLRTGVLPKATPQECAEQLIVCNPFEDAGFWEGIFYPMYDVVLTPQGQLECIVNKNQCIDGCENVYKVAAVACLGLPTAFAAAICESVAFAGFAYCQAGCVRNYPC
jgi:hypothetical protein